MVGNGILHTGVLSEISGDRDHRTVIILFLCFLGIDGLPIPTAAAPAVPGKRGLHAKAPEGIMELIDATNDLMPEGLQAGTEDIANFKLSRKRYLCQEIIGVATISGTVVGAVPISIADAVILKLQKLMRLPKSMELKMSSRRKNFLIPLLKWEQ